MQLYHPGIIAQALLDFGLYVADRFQGIHPPTAKPSASPKRPHVAALGMRCEPTAARKNISAAIPKNILPMVSSLLINPTVLHRTFCGPLRHLFRKNKYALCLGIEFLTRTFLA